MASRRRQEAMTKQSQSQSHVGLGGERKEELCWCVEGCGACCKLNKGPSFATPEEIFHDPSDIQLYRSIIGPDGWCVHYDKITRKCSIYADRPYFCRVEPDVFQTLYGIPKKKFNKEACSCRGTIKAIYGSDSKEMDSFNHSNVHSRPSYSILFLNLESYPQMDYSSYVVDGVVIQPSLSSGSYEYKGVPTNCDHFPSDFTFCGCPFFNSSGYCQEGLLQAIVPLPCREEKLNFPLGPWNNALETEEGYDGEQQPYHSCGNCLSDCNSVFNDCSGDNYGSLGNGNNSNPENTESSNTSEEQWDNSSFTPRDDEDAENYSAASAYDSWSCFDSWLAYVLEK